MTALILDAGAFIALDRNVRAVWSLLAAASDAEEVVQAPTGVIAQVWGGGSVQALLARALQHVEEVDLDGVAARAAGRLCGAAGTGDVIDASVAVTVATLARFDRVAVATSDPDDLRHLFATLKIDVQVIPV